MNKNCVAQNRHESSFVSGSNDLISEEESAVARDFGRFTAKISSGKKVTFCNNFVHNPRDFVH